MIRKCQPDAPNNSPRKEVIRTLWSNVILTLFIDCIEFKIDKVRSTLISKKFYDFLKAKLREIPVLSDRENVKGDDSFQVDIK